MISIIDALLGLVLASETPEIGTSPRLVRRLGERQLDSQDAVLVGGPCALGVDVGAELDLAHEGTVLDLDLLVDAALGVARPALAADDERAPPHLQADVVDVDPGEIGLDDRLRGLAAVVDVDARAEPGPLARGEPGARPDVAEQLVDLAAHALEVGEQVAAAWAIAA